MFMAGKGGRLKVHNKIHLRCHVNIFDHRLHEPVECEIINQILHSIFFWALVHRHVLRLLVPDILHAYSYHRIII